LPLVLVYTAFVYWTFQARFNRVTAITRRSAPSVMCEGADHTIENRQTVRPPSGS
jgi:hypothetical protein